MPDELSGSTAIPATSIPWLRRSVIIGGPNSSSPTLPTMLTWAPRRAAATAWFAPFPPGAV